MRVLLLFVMLFLVACDDDKFFQDDYISLDGKVIFEDFVASGNRDISLYVDDQNISETLENLPIVITDNKTYLISVPAKLANRVVYIEIDKRTREVILPASGETIFLP